MIDFIKDFKISDYPLAFWQILMLVLVPVAIYVLVNKLILFLPVHIAGPAKKAFFLLFNMTVCGLVAFIILNALLNEDYERLFMGLFVSMVPLIRWAFDKLYAKYDRLVDKAVDPKQ